MPKGVGLHHVNYLIIFSICLSAVMFHARWRWGPEAVKVSFLLLSFMIAYALSFTVNSSTLRTGALFELARPILMLVCFLVAYYLVRNGKTAPKKIIIITAQACILISMLVVAVQLNNHLFFDPIWSARKTRGIGEIVRLTGSMYNPNQFAMFSALNGLLVASTVDKRKALLWVAAVMAMIVLSGSRTLILAYPVALALVILLKILRPKSLWTLALVFPFLGLVTIALAVAAIASYGGGLPYLSQLSDAISAGSLMDVNSLHARFEHLQDIYILWSNGGFGSLLFGVGSIPMTRVTDNEFGGIFFRLGFIGLFLVLVIYFYFFQIAWRLRFCWVGTFSLSLLLLFLIVGITSEVLTGWMTSIYFLLALGFAAGEVDRGRAAIDVRPDRERNRSTEIPMN